MMYQKLLKVKRIIIIKKKLKKIDYKASSKIGAQKFGTEMSYT